MQGRKFLRGCLLGAALACLLSDRATASDTDLRFLLEGVTRIGAPGVPGPLCLYGENAFAVVAGKAGAGIQEPVAAVASLPAWMPEGFPPKRE